MAKRSRAKSSRKRSASRFKKWIKAAVAVLLLPVCLASAEVLFRLLRVSGSADTVWVALGAGVGCWLSIYLLLPKPMWVYVFGHELTHALWAWLFGGKVMQFRASSHGGHVIVTRTNFLVALAPYFFPIYALAVVALFGAGNLLWGWAHYAVWFHLLLGVAYAFHVTLTWHVLKCNQSDITDQGYLFSAVVIWLGNASVLLIGIPLLTREVSVATSLSWCWVEIRHIVHGCLLVR